MVRGLEYACDLMSMSVRRAVAIIAAMCLCAAAPSSVHAQTPEPDPREMGTPYSEPPLKGDFPDGQGAQQTPTATPEATATATSTATAEPTATATATVEPTATAGPGKRGDLPNTGSETLEVGLAGLTLIGFGISLRLRVALADARRPV